jgi:serine/threonine protein phosphatase PrpC
MGNLLGAPITEKETHTGWTPDGKLQYGVSSMQGWRIHMEDAHICQPFLYAEAPAMNQQEGETTQPNNNCRNLNSQTEEMSIKKQKNNEESNTTVMTPSSSTSSSWTQIPVPNHSLYAVFDGHGGSFAAQYAGRNFCRVLSRTSYFIQYAHHIQIDTSGMTEVELVQHRNKGLSYLEQSFIDAFVEIDREIYQHVHGDASSVSKDANTIYGANYQHDEVTQWQALMEQNQQQSASTDDTQQTAQQQAHAQSDPKITDGEDSGTTAVVVMVAPDWIVCANAGDSRAVYSKHGHRAVPLSYDHKPDDECEERRIREAGGFVSGNRVEGDLAVSRGLGDYRFKEPVTVLNGNNQIQQATMNGTKRILGVDEQKVSPIPDIVVQNRNEDTDEFIIVACDGIWDVETNQECVTMIAEIFEEGEDDNGLVCEEALDLCLHLGSKDNMTALIVRMPAQSIGIGGGVKARRQKREEAAKAELLNQQSESPGYS